MPTDKSPKDRPIWPTDDQVRELDRADDLSEDGRKLQDAERVGALSPDADPDRLPPRPRPVKKA